MDLTNINEVLLVFWADMLISLVTIRRKICFHLVIHHSPWENITISCISQEQPQWFWQNSRIIDILSSEFRNLIFISWDRLNSLRQNWRIKEIGTFKSIWLLKFVEENIFTKKSALRVMKGNTRLWVSLKWHQCF